MSKTCLNKFIFLVSKWSPFVNYQHVVTQRLIGSLCLIIQWNILKHFTFRAPASSNLTRFSFLKFHWLFSQCGRNLKKWKTGLLGHAKFAEEFSQLMSYLHSTVADFTKALKMNWKPLKNSKYLLFHDSVLFCDVFIRRVQSSAVLLQTKQQHTQKKNHLHLPIWVHGWHSRTVDNPKAISWLRSKWNKVH